MIPKLKRKKKKKALFAYAGAEKSSFQKETFWSSSALDLWYGCQKKRKKRTRSAARDGLPRRRTERKKGGEIV